MQAATALRLTSGSVGRRAAVHSGAAAVFPLFAGGNAVHAITDYAKKDFKDGVYVGPAMVGSAPTAEDEAKLEELYNEAVKKQEKVVKDMGL